MKIFLLSMCVVSRVLKKLGVNLSLIAGAVIDPKNWILIFELDSKIKDLFLKKK